jgi:tetratricopeptide (TPR) repeat protein
VTLDSTEIDAHWDFGNPAASEKRFRALLAEPPAADDPVVRAEVLTQVARAQGLQKAFDAAHATLDAIPSEVIDGSPRIRVRLLLERGRLTNSAGKAEASVPRFLEAWKASTDPMLDYFAVDAAHMLAIVTPPEEQVSWAEKAIQRAQSSEVTRARRWLGPLNNNLGWTHHDACRYEEALACFEAALAAFREDGSPKQVRVARWTVGRAHRSLGNVEEALSIQQQLEVALKGANETDGFVYEEMGECLLALDRSQEAAPWFHKAHVVLATDPWLVAQEPERLARLQRLAAP